MIGALLVLLTWALLLGAWMITGAAATSPRIIANAGNLRTRLRRSLWWGLAVFTLLVLAVGIAFPLRSPTAALVVLAVLVPLATLGVISLARTSGARGTASLSRRLLVGSLLIATAYLAWAALGPVTNYDTGLYHLGAIGYAGDYPTIPGLANLYFPFGYNNAQFPLAAFLGNGPWGGEGYRLLNGLLFAAMTTDLLLRVRSRSLGSYVLLVGAVVVAVPMVALDDYWITSPTSDSAVFILTIVSMAYFADGVARDKHAPDRAWPDFQVALVLAVLAVTLRPLMAVFALAMLAVVVVLQVRSARSSPNAARRWPGWTLWALMAAALAYVQSIRDYLLSGWLQYPLSIWPFGVAWQAPDPVWNRTPTLGAARDPQDLWAATEGWNWVGAWIARLPSQWEAYLLALLLIASLVAYLPVRSRIRSRRVLVPLIPAATVVLAWLVASPPSFRFVWGPIFALGVVPLAAALRAWQGSTAPKIGFSGPQGANRLGSAAITLGALAVLAITAVTALWRSDTLTRTASIEWRLGGLGLSLPVTPITEAAVIERELDSGLVVLIPTESDQCWDDYPLCTAQLEPTVSLRGPSLADGFTP